MLAGWLDGNPNFSAAEEAANEPEDYGTPSEQTGLHLPAPIDARPRPGKQMGAYSHSVTANRHPYVFMYYMGERRDVP